MSKASRSFKTWLDRRFLRQKEPEASATGYETQHQFQNDAADVLEQNQRPVEDLPAPEQEDVSNSDHTLTPRSTRRKISRFLKRTGDPYPILDHDKESEIPIRDPRPCLKCRMITFDALLSKGGYRHHETGRELLKAAVDMCKICIWICEIVFPGWSLDNAGGEGTFAPKARAPPGLFETKSELEPAMKAGFPLIMRYIFGQFGISIDGNRTLSLFVDEDHTLGVQLLKRIRKNSPEVAVRTFSDLPLHPAGSNPDSATPLPRRILDVADASSETVYLRNFDNNPSVAPYVCLSHRWATSMPLTTTTITLESRQSGIKITDLSRTMQDAILMTRTLGLRYLWIDSLCILQDSSTDWEIESSKMGDYYANSWLTLGAGLNFDPDGGLFSRRYKPGSNSSYYRLTVLDTGGKPLQIYFTGDDERVWDNRSASVLYTRGWTLQEEVLSPRFLSFQPRQMSFRLSDRVFHESGYIDDIQKTSFLYAATLDSGSWMRLIQDFSTRELTKEEDKLPAISGLAQRYQNASLDTYLAGIWLNSLMDHLCWCVPVWTAAAHKHGRTKPLMYRAPSWSWASVDKPVVFESYQSATQTGIDISSSIPKLQGKVTSKSSQLSPPEVVHASTEVRGQDLYGQVQGGSITLCARVSRQLWKRRGLKWYYAYPLDESISVDIRSSNVSYTNSSLLFDDAESFNDKLKLEIWSLPIRDEFALALQLSNGSETTFTRIGAICWRSSRDNGDDVPSRVIHII